MHFMSRWGWRQSQSAPSQIEAHPRQDLLSGTIFANLHGGRIVRSLYHIFPTGLILLPILILRHLSMYQCHLIFNLYIEPGIMLNIWFFTYLITLTYDNFWTRLFWNLTSSPIIVASYGYLYGVRKSSRSFVVATFSKTQNQKIGSCQSTSWHLLRQKKRPCRHL